MKFSNIDKLKALAIVSVFETSKPFGDYAACVVLNDGAGISYGINQFTHRSGSLLAVVEKYFESGGVIAKRVIEKHMPLVRSRAVTAINTLAANNEFKSALRAAAITTEMREAQDQVALERYLGPAIGACDALGFVLPLSLAVIYDSMTHGSWNKIRDVVYRHLGGCPEGVPPSDSRAGCPRDSRRDAGVTFEMAWITEYVRVRDLWLDSITRLRSTRYRTRFFLDQIAISNWELRLPVRVHGIRLTDDMFAPKDSAVGPIFDTSENPPLSGKIQPAPSTLNRPLTQAVPTDPQAQPPDTFNAAETWRKEDGEKKHNVLNEIEQWIYAMAARYDRVDAIVNAIVTRTDAAKSLWTTVVGTLWQTFWAMFAFLSGMPREIWLAAALIVGALTLFYLYRQIALGKIREKKM